MSRIPATFGLGSDKIQDTNIVDESRMRLAISLPIHPLVTTSLDYLVTLSRQLCCLLPLVVGMGSIAAHAGNVDERFTLDHASYGFEVGLGQTADIPACSNCPPPRTSHRFISLLTSYERNLTGLIAEQSPWHGALFWRIEGGVAVIRDNPAAKEDLRLINFSPLMVQYRLFGRDRAWNPKFLGGVGFTLTNWSDFGGQPLNSERQFLVHLGVGIESSNPQGTYSIDYRLLHVSNGGSDDPNIGINAHVVSITVPF